LIETLLFFILIALGTLTFGYMLIGRRISFILAIIFGVLLVFTFQTLITGSFGELENQLFPGMFNSSSVISTEPIFLPSDYYNDYIKLNQSQSKTQTHILRANYPEAIDIIIPNVDVYSWSNGYSKYTRNESLRLPYKHIPLLYYVTISHGNSNATWNAQTFSVEPGFLYLNKSSVPWLFPLKNGDTFNVTYTLNLKHASLISGMNVSDMIFVVPIKEQTVEDGLPPEQPPDNTLLITFIVVIGVVSGVVIGSFLIIDYYRSQTREHQREKLNIIRNSTTTFHDYSLVYATKDKDEVLKTMNDWRTSGYFTKIIIVPEGYHLWASRWDKSQIERAGIPSWGRRK
jgi:hypothetical protein